ncbi:MAG: hypothetical protein V3S55_04450 [Nitrospiraceae bacterium]
MALFFTRSVVDRIRGRVVVLLLCIALVESVGRSAAGAPDEASIKFLSLNNDGAASTDFSVLPETDLLLPFTWTVPKDDPKTFQLYVTPFRGEEQGKHITVEPSVVELPDLRAKEQRLTIALERPVMTIKLTVPDFPTTGKYKGQVVILHDGRMVRSATLQLDRAKPAQKVTLVIDRPAIRVTDPIWPWSSLPSFTIPVRNDSRWQAMSVFLRVMEVTGPKHSDLDPVENLRLTWNGKPVDDLLRSPPHVAAGAARTIPPRQQSIVTGRFLGLAAGEYTIKLGVAAANVKSDQQPVVTVKMRVRDSVVWALAVLFLAIMLSFIATKGLDSQRRRIALLKKISEIRPSWLRGEPSTLPVVAVRAILKQAEFRNRRWSAALFAPDIVSGRVDKAAQMLGPIRRLRQIRKRISTWNQDQMIRNRAAKRLRGIVADLSPETVDEKQATEIETRLNELEAWLTSDKLYQLYWVDLQTDVKNLIAQVRPVYFDQGDPRDTVTDLINKIESEVQKISAQPSGPQQQNDLRDYIEIEHDYAKLKIMWERLQDDDAEALKELAALLKGKTPLTIDQFFKAADNIAWRRLKDACKQGAEGLEFVSPRKSGIHPLQAYQLIEFEVAPVDRKLGNNYLFKHGLEYRWTLEIETEQDKKKGQPRKLLTKDTSEEPRIIQYVPLTGDLYVSVQLRRKDDPADVVALDDALPIASSGEVGWASAFSFVEVMALAIAAILAVVSGLGTFYFDEAVFGSVKDYIALFIWGAGVDLMKYSIQKI